MTLFANPVRWFLRTLAVYLAAALAAGALFIAAAAIWSVLG